MHTLDLRAWKERASQLSCLTRALCWQQLWQVPEAVSRLKWPVSTTFIQEACQHHYVLCSSQLQHNTIGNRRWPHRCQAE